MKVFFCNLFYKLFSRFFVIYFFFWFGLFVNVNMLYEYFGIFLEYDIKYKFFFIFDMFINLFFLFVNICIY